MKLPWMMIAGFFGLTAVMSGALNSHLGEQNRFHEIALQFHMFHVAPIMVTAFLANDSGAIARFGNLAGLLMSLGILLFSGSLYYLSFAEEMVGFYITPAGGLSFMAGWLCLMISGFLAWKRVR